jgi:hypothetical protein
MMVEPGAARSLDRSAEALDLAGLLRFVATCLADPTVSEQDKERWCARIREARRALLSLEGRAATAVRMVIVDAVHNWAPDAVASDPDLTQKVEGARVDPLVEAGVRADVGRLFPDEAKRIPEALLREALLACGTRPGRPKKGQQRAARQKWLVLKEIVFVVTGTQVDAETLKRDWEASSLKNRRSAAVSADAKIPGKKSP